MVDVGAGEVGEVEDFGEAGEVGSQPPDRAGDTYVKDYGADEVGEVGQRHLVEHAELRRVRTELSLAAVKIRT